MAGQISARNGGGSGALSRAGERTRTTGVDCEDIICRRYLYKETVRGRARASSSYPACQIPERALAIVLNAVLTSVPRVVTATTQITAIKPTSMPYSTKAMARAMSAVFQ